MDKVTISKQLEGLIAQRSIVQSAMETMQSDLARIDTSIAHLSHKIEAENAGNLAGMPESPVSLEIAL